jgi:hypothetical protein
MTSTTKVIRVFQAILLSALTLAGGQGMADESDKPKTTEAPGKGTNGALLLKPVTLPDPGRQNMPAHRVLVPDGWKLEGGLTAPPPSYHMLATLSDVTIKAPDGRGVRFFGPQEFGYADRTPLQPFTPYQGRPFMPLHQSLGDFWSRMFELNPAPGVTNLKVVEEEVMEEATEVVRKHLAPLYQSTAQENQQLSFSGEGKTFDVHVRRLVLQYDENGRDIEATIFASVRHSIYYYPDRSIRAAMWNLDNMYAVFGPVGTDYLSDPTLAAIVRSRQLLPEWQVAIETWYLMKNRQIVAEGQARIAAAARANVASKSSQTEDVLDISFNGWKKRNALNDAGQSRSVNAIREQTTYSNPVLGNTVNLPSYYQNVYTDQLGNYVLHNDANYEINTDPAFNNVEWTRIEPVE